MSKGRAPRIGAWFLALAAHGLACRTGQPRAPSWSSDGGELGQQIRQARVPGATHLQFESSILKREVGAVVVTPPGYAEHPGHRYPVVYVFPGIGGDEFTYLRDVGLDSAAVRALFADPERAPILVFANPADSGGYAQAQRVLSEELVGFIDVRYRTRAVPEARGLEGFSLGGATALSLLLHRPDVFGQAVALSSACYLLSTCRELRRGLVTRAKLQPLARVMLALGEREISQNRALSEELAPLLAAELQVVSGVDHDWAALIGSGATAPRLGERIAEFHLSGFAGARRE